MRGFLAGFILLLFATTAYAEVVLTDDAGDVEARHFGQASTPMSGYDAMDQLQLEIEEDPDGFLFRFTTADVHEETTPDQGNHWAIFRLGEQWYSVRLMQSGDSGAPFGQLLATTGPWFFGRQIIELETYIDTEAEQIWSHVPRAVLVDHEGKPAGRGMAFEEIHALSAAHSTGIYTGGFGGLAGGPAIVGDFMPQEYAPGIGARWDIRYGGSASSGLIRLAVDQPFRASNGEETTYEMTVSLTNMGEATRTFQIRTVDLPSNWEFIVGGSLIEVESGRTVRFPVFLSTPFAHQHGSTQMFQLRAEAVVAESIDADTWAEVDMGVHYLAVPQPAGHHNEVYFHSRPWGDVAGTVFPLQGEPNGDAFMNTLESDPADQGTPIRGDSDILNDQARYFWGVCLAPELRLGIDVDLTQSGVARIPLQSTEPIEGILEGRMAIIAPGGEDGDGGCADRVRYGENNIELVTLQPTPVSISPGGSTVVEVPLIPHMDGDYVPFQEGYDLGLFFEVTTDRPGVTGSAGMDLTSGGSMVLPFSEFHDALTLQPPSQNDTEEVDPEGVFVPEAAPVKDAVAPLLIPALAAAILVARRRQR